MLPGLGKVPGGESTCVLGVDGDQRSNFVEPSCQRPPRDRLGRGSRLFGSDGAGSLYPLEDGNLEFVGLTAAAEAVQLFPRRAIPLLDSVVECLLFVGIGPSGLMQWRVHSWSVPQLGFNLGGPSEHLDLPSARIPSHDQSGGVVRVQARVVYSGDRDDGRSQALLDNEVIVRRGVARCRGGGNRHAFD